MSEVDMWNELMAKQEPLHDDLLRFVTGDDTMMMLRHPLIYEVPYSGKLNAWINFRYKNKLERAQMALAGKSWGTLIYNYERPYRLEMLYKFGKDMEPKTYWPLLASVWVDSENAKQYTLRHLHRLWQLHPLPRTGIMDVEEQKHLASLPDELTIYRGTTPNRRKGELSWTLNSDIARWFMNRFRKPSDARLLLSGKVKKSSVWAYFQGEEEIVVPRRAVYDVIEFGFKNSPAAKDGEDRRDLADFIPW